MLIEYDEIKKAKERAEQARIQRLKTIEDYKNGAPLTGYQMKMIMKARMNMLWVAIYYFPLTIFNSNAKLGMPSNKKGKLDFIFKKD